MLQHFCKTQKALGERERRLCGVAFAAKIKHSKQSQVQSCRALGDQRNFQPNSAKFGIIFDIAIRMARVLKKALTTQR